MLGLIFHIMKSLIFLSFLILLFSCGNDHAKVDIAKELKRSKQLGLFIKEFKPKSVKINDTLNFDIVSAWLEYNFYYDDLDQNSLKKENWRDGTDWKIKKEFNPINKGHLSFLIKGDFRKKFKAYNNGWNLYYCQLIESKDTAINNNYTYFETYGPESYDGSTNQIELHFENYVVSKDTNKNGTWFSFGDFTLTEK